MWISKCLEPPIDSLNITWCLVSNEELDPFVGLIRGGGGVPKLGGIFL